jgi:hypothetical protein
MAIAPYRVIEKYGKFYPEYWDRRYACYRCWETCFEHDITRNTYKEAVEFVNKKIDEAIAAKEEVISHKKKEIKFLKSNRLK